MARTRLLKPDFFTNDTLGEIPPLGRLLFAGLWCHADRDGRLADRPKKLKVEILPYDDCDVESLLTELHRHGFIVRYEVDGVPYIQVANFLKHQHPHNKELPSTIPVPTQHAPRSVPVPEIPVQAAEIPEPVRPLTLTLNPLTDSGCLQPLPPSPEDFDFSFSARARGENEGIDEDVTEVVPGDLHPVNYAARILEEVHLPHTQDNLRTVAAAVECEIRGGKSPAAVYEFILAGVRDGHRDGWVIDKWFFSDAKYRVENRRNGNANNSKPSASAARSARSKQNILDGFAANAGRTDSFN